MKTVKPVQTLKACARTHTHTYHHPFCPQDKNNGDHHPLCKNLNTRLQSETCTSGVIPQNHSVTNLVWHVKQCNI